jgi:hypothetical protein
LLILSLSGPAVAEMTGNNDDGILSIFSSRSYT